VAQEGIRVALLAWVILVGLLLVALVTFVQRYYQKSARDVALVRTGAFGRRVVLDGGVLALPMLDRVDEISMRTHRIHIARAGALALLTNDRLRIDVEMEFQVRVRPTGEGVANAAQAFGAHALRSELLAALLQGRLVDSMQSSVAVRTLDALHETRGDFAAEVAANVRPSLEMNGLVLESVSLLQLDQTPFSALNENNVFSAVGMRRLAEIVAENKIARARIESDSELTVRQTRSAANLRSIDLQREEEEAQLAQALSIARSKVQQEAQIARAREAGRGEAEAARLARERALAEGEIVRDRVLEEGRMRAKLETELQRVEHAISLAQRQSAEATATIAREKAKLEVTLAQEAAVTARELQVHERNRELALSRVRQEAEVDAARLQIEAKRLQQLALAHADADRVAAGALVERASAEASAAVSRIAAENGQSAALMQFQLDMARLDKLPEIVGQIVKPLEKIESIRINHLSGFGGASGTPSANSSLFDLALQLPVLKQLGETIGADVARELPQMARAESDHARARVEESKLPRAGAAAGRGPAAPDNTSPLSIATQGDSA
jgi:flotillin